MVISVDLFFECLAGLEDRGIAGGKFHSLTGGRITSDTGIAMPAGEGAKSGQGYRLTCGERIYCL